LLDARPTAETRISALQQRQRQQHTREQSVQRMPVLIGERHISARHAFRGKVLQRVASCTTHIHWKTCFVSHRVVLPAQLALSCCLQGRCEQLCMGSWEPACLTQVAAADVVLQTYA
jgi:hypothetical protein